MLRSSAFLVASYFSEQVFVYLLYQMTQRLERNQLPKHHFRRKGLDFHVSDAFYALYFVAPFQDSSVDVVVVVVVHCHWYSHLRSKSCLPLCNTEFNENLSQMFCGGFRSGKRTDMGFRFSSTIRHHVSVQESGIDQLDPSGNSTGLTLPVDQKTWDQKI